MNVDELRNNKTEAVSRLSKEGVSVRQIAILLYDDDSEGAQHRVRALISKLRKKKVSSLVARQQPQPQPKKRPQGRKIYETVIKDGRMIKGEHKVAVKHPEEVVKGKASDTVLSWLDEDGLARQLADECYEKARKCYEEKDYENAFRFMELVSRFLRLSQTARKEYDLEELKKAVAEEYEV